ncbi:hypothetical protein T06_828 [Trichinella sp. T6]|nr:hypothetical protein T06_828 [Trichinella sp. T6]
MNSEGKNKETMNKHAYLLSSANVRMVRNFYNATDALSNQAVNPCCCAITVHAEQFEQRLGRQVKYKFILYACRRG